MHAKNNFSRFSLFSRVLVGFYQVYVFVVDSIVNIVLSTLVAQLPVILVFNGINGSNP